MMRVRNNIVVLVTALLLLVAYAPPASSTTRTVFGPTILSGEEIYLASPSGGDDYARIQAACGAAPYTNIVRLGPGTWRVSQQLNCNNIIAEGGNCYFWYEGYTCPTVILQIAGTWATNDAIVRATPGKPAYYRGFQTWCGVSNGTDGVVGFEIGGVHGVTLDRTHAFRCQYGYSVLNDLTQQVWCHGCVAMQNKLWGFAVRFEGTNQSLADSTFDGQFVFVNNGWESGAFTAITGGVQCYWCQSTVFSTGQIEDHYGTETNGWRGRGIEFSGGSLGNRVNAVKWDQNVDADIAFVSSGDGTVLGAHVLTGNFSTTSPPQGNVALRFTGTASTAGIMSFGNIWYGKLHLDNLSGTYTQCQNCDFADGFAGGYTDAYTKSVIDSKTLIPIAGP